MNIIIDGDAKDWKVEQGMSLQDVMLEVNQTMQAEHGRIIVAIKLDEYEEGLDTDLTWEQVTADKIKQVSLETETIPKHVDTSLESATGFLKESRDSVSTIVGDMLAGETGSANDALKETVEKLMWFFNLLTELGKAEVIDIEQIKIKNEIFKDFVVRFNTTLNEIADSMANNDTTLINDFLEYELEPAIADLIELVPVLREEVSGKFSEVKE